MKRFLLALIAIVSILSCKQPGSKSPQNTVQVVEASCGTCQFDLKGKDCALAVRIKGKAYFVDGTGIDDHGDAHAKNGFCEAIRKAEVSGKVVNGRFVTSYFKLLPQ